MTVPICEHIKIGGVRCGSPALGGQKYCYYHLAVHHLVPKMNLFVDTALPYSPNHPDYSRVLPYLEDTGAIQIGYAQLIHAVSNNRIDHRRARLILNALQGAAANLRHADKLVAKGLEFASRKKPTARVKKASREAKRNA